MHKNEQKSLLLVLLYSRVNKEANRQEPSDPPVSMFLTGKGQKQYFEDIWKVTLRGRMGKFSKTFGLD